jgi:predicted dienelactone hydrolase
VKAVFAMAPALGFTETPESLRAMKVPVEMVVGDADKTAPPRDNADSLRNNIHGARETVLPGVTHYAFLDECTAQGKQALPQYCVDPPGMDRAAVHAETVQLAIPFFDKALRLR